MGAQPHKNLLSKRTIRSRHPNPQTPTTPPRVTLSALQTKEVKRMASNPHLPSLPPSWSHIKCLNPLNNRTTKTIITIWASETLLKCSSPGYKAIRLWTRGASRQYEAVTHLWEVTHRWSNSACAAWWNRKLRCFSRYLALLNNTRTSTITIFRQMRINCAKTIFCYCSSKEGITYIPTIWWCRQAREDRSIVIVIRATTIKAKTTHWVQRAKISRHRL